MELSEEEVKVILKMREEGVRDKVEYEAWLVNYEKFENEIRPLIEKREEIQKLKMMVMDEINKKCLHKPFINSYYPNDNYEYASFFCEICENRIEICTMNPNHFKYLCKKTGFECI